MNPITGLIKFYIDGIRVIIGLRLIMLALDILPKEERGPMAKGVRAGMMVLNWRSKPKDDKKTN